MIRVQTRNISVIIASKILKIKNKKHFRGEILREHVVKGTFTCCSLKIVIKFDLDKDFKRLLKF